MVGDLCGFDNTKTNSEFIENTKIEKISRVEFSLFKKKYIVNCDRYQQPF